MPPRSGANRKSETTAAVDAVCPFCSLLCDDLELRQTVDRSFRVTRNGCARARADFARAPIVSEPLVDGQSTSLEKAVAAAARLLKRSEQPLIAGLATDVDGIRAAVDLAERCGGILDHVHGDVMNAANMVLQSRGWYATTLSELRNRADFVLLAGVDLNERYENLSRRCLRPAASLHTKNLRKRRIVYLGSAASAPRDDSTECISCRAESMAETLQALLATLKGARLSARSIGGVSRKTFSQLADALKAAAYAVIVFAPASLGIHRESAIAAICDIADELNREGRGAILSLGGDDGGQTAVSTCAWMTGYPLRVSFGKTLHYDPLANSADKLMSSGAVDGLVWIDAFGRHANPPAGNAATVILSSVKTAAAQMAAVYIPVGTPGVDHFSRLLRTDSVVSLPLPGLRNEGLPDVAAVLTLIASRL